MDRLSPQTPQLKRFQLSLKALFAAMVGASIYIGLIILRPEETRVLTIIFLLGTCFVLCFLKGFYLVGLGLMLFVGLLFHNSFVGGPRYSKKKSAQAQIEKFAIALVMYEGQFREYPPNTLNGNSAADLFQAIDKSKKAQLFESEIVRKGSVAELISPWGFPLHYQRTVDAQGRAGFVVIATGADGLLGGTLSEDKGFVPDNSDANGDGAFDHEDNIVSEMKP